MDRFSDRQRMVAQYILTDYDDAAFFTAAKLAEASNVSEATVIRFANRMGYSRYSDMQKDLRLAMRDKLNQMDRFRRSGEQKGHSSMMQRVIRFMRSDMRNIEQTLMSLQEGELAKAVHWIATARKVFVVGSHSEYGIACYFASTLCWIRDQVYLVDEQHSPVFDAMADAGEQDVMVALSFPPYPLATVHYLQAVIRRGARGVAITDSPLSPLAKRAHCCLFSRDEKLSFADNSAPTISLLSVILDLVSGQNFEASSERLRNKQKFWEEIGFYHQEE
jgi:DNA-binding MurR/RpiR family transcriptional regulator